MNIPRMYDEFAHLWTLISAPEDYAEEAGYWRKALRDRLGQGRHQILELGVGGGNNLSHLTDDFQATAVDISVKMLANSRCLNPGVKHFVGDMRTVRLNRTFSAVLIHDGVSYMQTEADLLAAFATARAHLEPGGVFITAPDWFKETFPGRKISSKLKSRDGHEMGLVEFSYDPDPSDTTMETLFIYIFNPGEKPRVEEDIHVMGLFSQETWIELMEEAGFQAETLNYPVAEDGHEMYLLVGAAR